jgi:hypothetical protein
VRETVYRAASDYLLKQYLLKLDGHEVEMGLTSLRGFYKGLEDVNYRLMERIRESSEEDANMNAVCTFFSFSAIFSIEFDGMLQELRPFLSPRLLEA